MMHTPGWIRISAALLSLSIMAAAPAAENRRLTPAEIAALRQTVVDLTLEIEQLRAEIRELRGQVEVQTHELETLKTRNREALADLDKRLSQAERRATPADPASSASAPAVPANEQQEYEAAFNLLKQGYYDRAIISLREFIQKYPKGELAANAQYWIGEAQYVLRNFKVAAEEFAKVPDRYPSSPKVPDALLKLGYSYYELGTMDRARDALQQVISRYPNTPQAKSAETRLAEIKAAQSKPAPKPAAKPAPANKPASKPPAKPSSSKPKSG